MDRMVVAAIAIAVASATCHGDERSDAEIRAAIVWNLAPRCGGGTDRDRLHRRPSLADSVGMGGDTGRLARVLADIAQTNDAWYARVAMRKLEKYGTSEQLPFLYSCATNPAAANSAVKAVLRIEGVTSNSVAMMQNYLSFTNSITRQQAYDRAVAGKEFLACLQNSAVGVELKESALQIVREFAADINTSNSIVDEALVAADSTYRYSKRRLAVMRSAYPRCFNEYQTNYVTNAINELVAYPEANLPD